MLKLNLQFFAHKRVSVPPRTEEIPSQSVSARRERMDSLSRPAIFCTDSAERRFIPALMSVRAAMIRYLLWLTVS